MQISYIKSMILSCAVAFAYGTSSAIDFRSGEMMLRLSDSNGAVESLVAADGSERVMAAAEAFTLQLLDGKGEPTRLKSSDFAFSRKGNCLSWRHANGLHVSVLVTAADDGFRFKPAVERIPAGMLLEWFDGPQICISPDKKLFWPEWDGLEITNYNSRPYYPVGYRKRFARGVGSSLYPGLIQMQFMAAYKDGKGVYFSAVDDRHTPKGVDWDQQDGKAIRLTLQTFCGDLDKDGAWRPKFHYSLRPYEGGWMEACEIYRDWVRTLPDFQKKPNRPKWMYDSPVNLIYPIRGEGSDSKPRDMKPNRYFPYVNAMSAVEKYGKLLDSRIMALLMHWEGTAPWAPPYVWPPFGGEKALAEFRDALHKRGDLLGVYCSGTAWTQISAIVPTYSQEQRFEDEHLGRHMMRGPKGEITATICNGFDSQKLGYDMCLADDWCAREIAAEIGKLSHFGIDYSQFFDQNLGGGWLLCYAKHHNHPPIPGAWAVDAMRALQKRLVAAGNGMVFGCEQTAATPYVPTLPYSDTRPMFGLMYFGRPVAGSAFVFHEWMCNFTGNQCLMRRMDPCWRWASGFVNGDMFSLVLGDRDEVVQGWPSYWKDDFPDRAGFVAFVKRMNDIRKRYPSFLLEGRMVRPFLKCESRPAAVKYEGRKTGTVETTEVLASFWENLEGERICFAVNWRREPSELRITHADGRVETRTLAPLEAQVLDAE